MVAARCCREDQILESDGFTGPLVSDMIHLVRSFQPFRLAAWGFFNAPGRSCVGRRSRSRAVVGLEGPAGIYPGSQVVKIDANPAPEAHDAGVGQLRDSLISLMLTQPKMLSEFPDGAELGEGCGSNRHEGCSPFW